MRLPTLSVTTAWKWFWFVCAAVALKGPQFVELATSLQLPTLVHWGSFVVGLAGLLLTLQIHPTPATSQETTDRHTLPPPLAVVAFLVVGTLSGLGVTFLASCTAAQGQQAITDETLALDLTQAACSAATTTGNAYVEFACALAQVAEDGTISVTKLLVDVPAGAAPAFAANAPGARRVTRTMLRAFVPPTSTGR